MSSPGIPYEHYFTRLMSWAEDEGAPEDSALFRELLRTPALTAARLANFLTQVDDSPAMAVLVTLLGKCMTDSRLGMMMHYLESEHAALRRAAANALGWNRARGAIQSLYQLELNDPDDSVRHEARAAIDEILREYPNISKLVPNHEPTHTSEVNLPVSHDEVPVDHSDEKQRLKLIATLPRLLACKYQVVPLHLSPNDQLHLAVPMGSEKRLIPMLSELTGHHVQLHPWPVNQIRLSIEQVYALGDDDFCSFHETLTPMARVDVVELILDGVNPDEPACPLQDANDSVEGAQAFLAMVVAMNIENVLLQVDPPEMTILAELKNGQSLRLEPPPHGLRERFLDVLRILSGLEPGAGISGSRVGGVRLVHHDQGYTLTVKSEKTLEYDRLSIQVTDE